MSSHIQKYPDKINNNQKEIRPIDTDFPSSVIKYDQFMLTPDRN